LNLQSKVTVEAPPEANLELIQYFADQAVFAGADVSQADDLDEAARTIRELASNDVRCTTTVFELFPDLQESFQSWGIQFATAGEIAKAVHDRSDLAVALAGKTGVIAAYAGVAETGSVLVADDSLGNRLVGMLSETCIVLLAAGSIVANLDDAGAKLSELEQQGHRFMSMITGPSRTADIERVLTIGVQGPKALHIIVVY
jgi:L-lactate dehydrogenase complex protein LldG